MLLGCFRFKLNLLLMSNVNFVSRFLMCKYVRLKSNMIHHLNKFTTGFKVVYALDDIGFVVESSVFLEFSAPSRGKNANIILNKACFHLLYSSYSSFSSITTVIIISTLNSVSR